MLGEKKVIYIYKQTTSYKLFDLCIDCSVQFILNVSIILNKHIPNLNR